MLTAIDLFFGAFEGVLIALVILRHRPHVLIALHAIVFWLFVVVFNGISTWALEARYDELTYTLVHSLVLLYLMIALGLGIRFRRSSSAVIQAVDELPAKVMALCMAAWLAFRLYLLGKYGVASFQLLALREFIGASYWEVALLSYLWYLAFGAFLAFVVQAALRPRRALSPVLLGLAVSVLVFAVLFNEVAGARRFLLMIAVLVVLVALYRHGSRSLGMALIAALPLIAAGEYYQRIRENMITLEFVNAIADGEYATAVGIYLDPTYAASSRSTVEALEDRFSPFKVLYVITAQQLERGTTTGGELVKQSVLNVVPSAFITEKETINADEQLADAFDALPRNDLPSGVLAMFQAEFWFFGYLLAPALLCLVAVTYGTLMKASESHVLRLLFLCLAVSTAQLVEELLDGPLVNARDAIVIAGAVWLLRFVTLWWRRSMSTAQSA